MDFSIETFSKGQLDELAKQTNLGEEIDYDCKFMVGRKDGKIAGIVGINLSRLSVPQLEHTIIRPEFQKTRLVVQLLKKMENYVRETGNKGYISFILYNNIKMINYARKWGMKTYKQKENGAWFEKRIGV